VHRPFDSQLPPLRPLERQQSGRRRPQTHLPSRININSMTLVNWSRVAADLKPIYQAATLEEAETALEAFAEKWDETYPAISQICLRHWQNIIPIFDYPMDIRRVIYTTNAIESVNRSLCKVIKTKAVFPDEDSVFKLMYLALKISQSNGLDPSKMGRPLPHILLFCFQNDSNFEPKSAYTKIRSLSNACRLAIPLPFRFYPPFLRRTLLCQNIKSVHEKQSCFVQNRFVVTTR
jgi:hypothetical protein